MFKIFIPVTLLAVYGGSSVINLYTAKLTMGIAIALSVFGVTWLLKQVCTNVMFSLTEQKTGMAWLTAVAVLFVFFSLAMTVP